MGKERRTVGRRAGLNSAKVVDTALALSGERGLGGWSMRDLASRLDVAPSVIYHYFPNRDALVDAVIERACAGIALPDPALGWKEWFLQLAKDMRRVFLSYNGMADQISLGKVPVSSLPLLDEALGKLRSAGFGASAAMAYMMIFNVAIGAIAGKDHRSPSERQMPHDLDAMLTRIAPWAETSENMRSLIDDFLEPLSEMDAEGSVNTLSEAYFDLIMKSILAGIEATLPQGARGART